MHIHTKYAVSILNPVARRVVHSNNDTDNYARQTNHDYIGSFDRIPNEPKRVKKWIPALYGQKVS